MHVAPEVGDLGDSFGEVVAAAGQRRRVDGAGRGAGDDLKGVVMRRPAFAGDAHDGLQHADLIGRPGTAAGQQQAGHRGRGGGQLDGGVHAASLVTGRGEASQS